MNGGLVWHGRSSLVSSPGFYSVPCQSAKSNDTGVVCGMGLESDF